MPRPLMQCGVSQLEEMFTKGKSAPKVLKQLERELQFRQVPRAVALLGEVQEAMSVDILTATKATKSTQIPIPVDATTLGSQQPELWEASSAPSDSALQICTAAVTDKLQESLQAVKPTFSAPSIDLSDAYNVLKTVPGASWEAIEQTRRTLVQSSHPTRLNSLSTEKRIQALVEAKRVNTAYCVLSKARCDGL